MSNPLATINSRGLLTRMRAAGLAALLAIGAFKSAINCVRQYLETPFRTMLDLDAADSARGRIRL